MKAYSHSTITMLALGLALTTATAQAAGDHQVRAWAASCAACHGTDGRAAEGMLSLAGRDRDELYKLLIDFKSGQRPATVMHQHAKGYSDEELKQLATFFAAQPNR